MKLDEFSQATGISKRNVHFYIDAGLINPGRSENNYYDFSQDDVDIARKIVVLRKAGMTLDSIKGLETYPHWLNYYLSKTVIELKNEIQERQTQIENALTILDTVSPHATPDDIPEDMEGRLADRPEKEYISEMYGSTDDFMVITFLLVQYVMSEKNFYKRYIWNEIARELRVYLGDAMDFIRNVIYSRDMESLNNDVTEMSGWTSRTVSRKCRQECVLHLTAAVEKLYADTRAQKKWKRFYSFITEPLARFYREKGREMIGAYNPEFGEYSDALYSVIKERDKHIRERSDFYEVEKSLEGIFSFDTDDTYCDYFMLYLFFDSFYTKDGEL